MSETGRKIIVSNKRAFFDHEIIDRVEAGIVLKGPEIKSIRAGHVSIAESFAYITHHEIWLMNCTIQEYDKIAHERLDTRRNRKLLMHKKEIIRWESKTAEKGFTIVPLHLYFYQNKLKVELGLARAKKIHDKREAIKEKDIKRELDRARKFY